MGGVISLYTELCCLLFARIKFAAHLLNRLDFIPICQLISVPARSAPGCGRSVRSLGSKGGKGRDEDGGGNSATPWNRTRKPLCAGFEFENGGNSRRRLAAAARGLPCPRRFAAAPGGGGLPSLPPRFLQNNYVADLCGETCAKREPAPNWGRNQPRPGAKRAGAPLGNRNAAKGWRKTRSRPSPEFTAFHRKVADFIRRAREAIAVADVLAAEREALRPPRQLIHTIRVTHIRDGVVVQDKIIRRIVSLKRRLKRAPKPAASAARSDDRAHPAAAPAEPRRQRRENAGGGEFVGPLRNCFTSKQDGG